MFRSFRILPEDQALDLHARLSTAEWDVGRTRNPDAMGTVKRNQEIVPRSDNEPFWKDVMAVRDAMMRNAAFNSYTLMHKMTVPKFNRYSGGGTYRRHYDASPMTVPDMRTDFSCTLFLTPPDQYDGGELCVEDGHGNMIQAPKGEPGTCVVYDCGQAHWVNPVPKGTRISVITWMRSMVKDAHERRLLTQFTEILHRCERDKKPIEAFSDDYTTLTGIQTALCRKWMDA